VLSGADAFISPGESVTVNFAIQNAGQAVTGNLVGTLLGTGGVSAPSAAKTYGTVVPGGTAEQSFTFTANGSLGETIHATIELKDGPTNLGTVVFPITLGRLGPLVNGGSEVGTAIFSSNTALQLPRRLSWRPGNASPYPSIVNISGLPPGAVVTKVKLHLHHFAHLRSADLDMLLVSPGRQKVIPLSDIGVDGANDIELVIDDAAEISMPESTGIFSGTYRPTDRGASADKFPSAAPKKPYDANLATFQGTPAAGDWKLFIRDDATGAVGGLGGWSLEISYAY